MKGLTVADGLLCLPWQAMALRLGCFSGDRVPRGKLVLRVLGIPLAKPR